MGFGAEAYCFLWFRYYFTPSPPGRRGGLKKASEYVSSSLKALKQDCVVYVTVLYLSKLVSYRGNNMRWLTTKDTVVQKVLEKWHFELLWGSRPGAETSPSPCCHCEADRQPAELPGDHCARP